jgi:hypothetical protein
MNEKEKETINNMEMEKTNDMEEKVHYEIKFTETEDGYVLEASGDKKALKRLGIGPNMVGKKFPPGRGRHGRRARELRKVNRQRRWLAEKARRLEGMNQPWPETGFDRPRRRGTGFTHRGRFQSEPEHGR